MRKIINTAKSKVTRHWHSLLVTGHVGYFSAAFIEAHGIYGQLAGGMAVMITLGAILHLGD